MPASLPGVNAATNLANPAAGSAVIFDLLSGPKGSPLDVRKLSYVGGNATYVNDAANQTPSTGALSTGIGYGMQWPIIGPTAPASIKAEGFTDDYTPGVSKPDATASADSRFMYIGGGKSTANVNGIAPSVPYTAGFGLGGAGNGGSRDAGAGPAFTGFLMKTVTAAAGIAVGAAVEATWLNRTNRALVAGESVFGSSNAASAAVV